MISAERWAQWWHVQDWDHLAPEIYRTAYHHALHLATVHRFYDAHDEAEDIAQQVLLALYPSRVPPALGIVVHCTKQRVVDRWRTHYRYMRDVMVPEVTAVKMSADQKLTVREELQNAMQMVYALPEDLRSAMLKRLFSDEVLTGAERMRILRARAYLMAHRAH